MRSENIFIQLQLELQRLQKENQNLKQENAILDTALINACQAICRSMDYDQTEIVKLKQRFIDRVKDNYKEG